jgi:ferritin-like protein
MHPATEQILRYFEHLSALLAEKSKWFHDLAHRVAMLPEGPEVTTCLRKLLEAKDCAVRVVLPVAAARTATTEVNAAIRETADPSPP